MRSASIGRAVVYVSAGLMTLLLVRHFYVLGGPYFEFPQTVEDHVDRVFPLSRDAIVMSRRAAPFLPRGATVTVLAPALAPNWDATHYLTGSGLLPHQHVVHPALIDSIDSRPDFVIAVRAPLNHAHYLLVHEFPEGKLYRRIE